ncbi:MAG: tRNA (adenosine(37)-N6)-threonylcarbamoyltransferase complex ATPase subunit type 1 TsaE [Bacteroidota bacterium]
MNAFVTHSREETIALGKMFAASIQPGDVIALIGNLGSGKTQFVTGVCEGFGAATPVTSPTFTLINEHQTRRGKLVHIDLYRLSSRRELGELGLEEYINGQVVCLIEWAEIVLDLLPDTYYLVKLNYGSGEQDREIVIERVTRPGLEAGL